MAWNGIFYNGVFSMGFDMAPAAAEIFTQTANGSASSSLTPFSFGYSWSMGNTNGILFNVNLTTVIVGARYYLTGLPANGILYGFYDATGAAIQVALRLNSTGQLQFYLGSGTGTTIGPASSAGTIAANTWNYIECKVTISATVGQVECYVNGTQVITTAASQNTQSTVNAFQNAFQFVNLSGISQNLDDWYMLDTTGASPLNTYLGNIRVVGQAANAASGAAGHTQWTPTNPTNVNWSNTANIPANTAQYNSDGTVGDIDSYAFPAIGGNPASVLFLNHWYKTELDTAGVRTVVPGCRSGATDFFDTTAQTPLNGTYKYFNKPWTQDPNTSAAWTIANAQNAELAVKINT